MTFFTETIWDITIYCGGLFALFLLVKLVDNVCEFGRKYVAWFTAIHQELRDIRRLNMKMLNMQQQMIQQNKTPPLIIEAKHEPK